MQFLTISDWHGQLDPLNVAGVGAVGGAAVLSTYFQQERATNPNSLTMTAGDAVGASPPISSFFGDVPTIEAMRLMGFSADALGNHNFDRGIAHLQQLIDVASASSGQVGARFQYVSANLANRDANLSGVKDFEIFEVGGVKVAVIGLTNPEAPTLVAPGAFGTMSVTDPVQAANKARARARRAGAKVFVVLIHAGITGRDASGAAVGPLVDFANAVGGFDLIVGDHTDQQYAGVHNGAVVVENLSRGATYARVQLTVDPRNGRRISDSVTFVTPLASAVTPDPAVAALVDSYRAQLVPILNTQIGNATRVIPRSDVCGRADGRLCESLVGNVIADAMRVRYGTDIAITNAGGIRASLTCPTTDNASDFCPAYVPPPYPITRGQVLTVLPFGNEVVTVAISGTELLTFLENGVSAMPGANGRFPQLSGLCFTYDVAAPAGNRVVSAVRQAADGTCTGASIDFTAAAWYSLATNDFMATGGDGYPTVISRAVTRDLMDEVLADHVSASSPLSPTRQGRITCTSSGPVACPVVIEP
ncbi:bifunctional metallophosphatase/5'-nucleotidase [Luteitalea sp. TBR-22]|uniref:bifunctional metallophosphatase/5'-nucleotidase n=1 Tax=Luteitalea sp. TBR-22 TaxID=2802971 RepID=UPI001AF1EF8B|nr:5'-nucleotidase C-terminal domain-containing protein [Luteitalea sp. TBR-22]BCS32132.1 bifunctional metallophosphatase/5'-nucleotidase [Luteitalea sp. TBR-22]